MSHKTNWTKYLTELKMAKEEVITTRNKTLLKAISDWFVLRGSLKEEDFILIKHLVLPDGQSLISKIEQHRRFNEVTE